jgi:predicted transcriptional regulator
VDTLKLLEKQSGFLRLISYLQEKGETQITTIIGDSNIPVHQLYSSIEKGKSIGIIKTRVDTTSYPHKNMISLTDKGQKIGEKILEIMELVNSD